MCRAAGFTPAVYGGTVESIRAAADLVARGRCLYCVPSSCIAALPGTVRRPLTDPASCYPWSVLWRATEASGHVHAVVSCAQAMSQRLGGRRCIVSGWGRVALVVVAAVALVPVRLEPDRTVLVSLAGLTGGTTARRAGRRC